MAFANHFIVTQSTSDQLQSCTKWNEWYPIVLSFCFKKDKKKKLLSWTNSKILVELASFMATLGQSRNDNSNKDAHTCNSHQSQKYTGRIHNGGLSHLNCIFVDYEHRLLYIIIYIKLNGLPIPSIMEFICNFRW